MIPVDVIYYDTKPNRKLNALVKESFNRLPKNVQMNLTKHKEKNCRVAKIIFHRNNFGPNEAVLFLKRSGLKNAKKVDWGKTIGNYFPADNVIFINVNKGKDYFYIINHELAHLINHHNLNKHHQKWKILNDSISINARITKYAEKNSEEHFAEVYAFYIKYQKLFDFMKEEVFKN